MRLVPEYSHGHSFFRAPGHLHCAKNSKLPFLPVPTGTYSLATCVMALCSVYTWDDPYVLAHLLRQTKNHMSVTHSYAHTCSRKCITISIVYYSILFRLDFTFSIIRSSELFSRSLFRWRSLRGCVTGKKLLELCRTKGVGPVARSQHYLILVHY
jgi:hypothetical protein